MTGPVARLHVLAARIVDPRTLQRVVDPIVADVEWEREQLARQGRIWRGRWIACAGCLALLSALVAYSCSRARQGLSTCLHRDDDAIARVMAFTLASALVLTAVLIALPYSRFARPVPTAASPLWLLLSLLPQAIGVALPAGFVAGALVALRGRATSWRPFGALMGIAAGLSLLVFTTSEFAVPVANQSFRVWASGRASVAKGPNELTTSELRHRIDSLELRPGFEREVRSLRFTIHMRRALAASPLAIALFAFGFSAVGRGLGWTVACGLAAVAACVVEWSIAGRARSVTAAWALDAALGLSGLLLTIAGTRAPIWRRARQR